MGFEMDYDAIRDRELNEYLDKTWIKVLDDPDFYDECKAERYEQAEREYRDWLDAKEIND